MKKTITSLVILLMFLVPAMGNASYLIRLKNGGQLATPAYWTEGNWIFFFCVGGTAGMERKEIDRIERDDTYDKMAAAERDTIKVPILTPQTEKPQGQPRPNQIKEGEEKIAFEALKNQKDKMVAEVDELKEKMQEAFRRNDHDANARIKEELREKTLQVYKLTDEVKVKNKGKLPEGW